MLNETDLLELLGHDVLDHDGKSIGQIECFFNDKETGTPEWIGVFTGMFRPHHYLVPVERAVRESGVIRVPWTNEQVRAAPEFSDPEQPITETVERDAYQHYGLKSAAA
jgi:hypothetical protein